MEEKLSFFAVLILLLIGCGNAENWQGIGDMTVDNMTDIWSYINKNFHANWDSTALMTASDQTLATFVTDFSDYLNGLWDPAWNVVVVA